MKANFEVAAAHGKASQLGIGQMIRLTAEESSYYLYNLGGVRYIGISGYDTAPPALMPYTMSETDNRPAKKVETVVNREGKTVARVQRLDQY